MHALVLLDPPHTLTPTADTSLVLIKEWIGRGHTASICLLSDLWMQGPTPRVRHHLVEHVNLIGTPVLTLGPAAEGPVASFDTVWIRKDPPFDQAYLFATHMLEQVRGHAFIFNDPRGLREANEKLYIFHFPEWLAPTIVSQRIEDIRHFLQDQGGQLILKPLDGFGGSSIFHLRADDPNTSVILETMTHNETRWVMAQQYLPAARSQGDKRILLLGGKPIGALLRVPQGVEVRSNLRVGGKAHATEITAQEQLLCEALAPRLLQDGLHFVGLDVIGGILTEVNVTSPTSVQAVNRLYGVQLEKQIINFVEKSTEPFVKARVNPS